MTTMNRWIETPDGDYVNAAHLSRIVVTNQWKNMEGRWQVRGFFAADGLGSIGTVIGLLDSEDEARWFAGHVIGVAA